MRGKIKRRSQFSAAIRVAMVLVLSCWYVFPAYAGFPHKDGTHKEIEALESEWRGALLSGNIAAMDHLLADDYLGINAYGTLETKADVLTTHRSGRIKITQMDLSDIKIRIYGDTAVVTSKVELAGKNGDRDVSGRYRYTRVYNYRLGQWKIVSFEASRIPTNSHEEKH
jgi:ketosteroid isomerase-like protein